MGTDSPLVKNQCFFPSVFLLSSVHLFSLHSHVPVELCERRTEGNGQRCSFLCNTNFCRFFIVLETQGQKVKLIQFILAGPQILFLTILAYLRTVFINLPLLLLSTEFNIMVDFALSLKFHSLKILQKMDHPHSLPNMQTFTDCDSH